MCLSSEDLEFCATSVDAVVLLVAADDSAAVDDVFFLPWLACELVFFESPLGSADEGLGGRGAACSEEAAFVARSRFSLLS